MPPRYAYWTILVDNQPTAFRAGSQEELLPTFNRLKEKNPSAEMKWWQNGKLWESRVDAQEAMRARGEMGRRGDTRQGGGFRDRDRAPRSTEPREERDSSGKLGWKPKGEFTPAPRRDSEKPPAFAKATAGKQAFKSSDHDLERPAWKPKGSFKPERPAKSDWKPKGTFRPDRAARPEWKSEAKGRGPRRPVHRSATREGGSAEREGGSSDDRPRRSEKPEWKPKGTFKSDRPAKPEWKSKSRDDRPRSAWKPKAKSAGRPFTGRQGERQDRGERPEWKPKGAPSSAPREKRKWVPKEEFEKSRAAKVPRDKNWRPGGLHKDPKQKYKDAKKAKWGRFKQTIRKRWEGKQGGKKKKDDE